MRSAGFDCMRISMSLIYSYGLTEVAEPNHVWVSDITYIWTAEGWLYLAVILDLFSRQVVSWSMNNRINRKLAMDALLMGTWRRRPAPDLIFHSDRGSQY